MSTDEMIDPAEADKTEENLQNDKKDMLLEKTPPENTYKIFEFFKKHLGMLATCVSAVIAIMSIILNFAVGHMNHAYLRYWNISSIHANLNNQNEIHLVACALLYFLSIMLVNGLLSRTADTFGYYNKVLTRIHHTIKETNRERTSLYKELRKLGKEVKQFEQVDGAECEDIRARLEQNQKQLDQGKEPLKALHKAKRGVALKVTIEIIATLVISYLILGFALLLLNFSSTIEQLFRTTLPALCIVALDLLVYFAPAYFTTRCTFKQFKQEDSNDFVLKLIEGGVPNFPVEELARKEIKSFLSDKSIKLGLGKLVFSTVVVLFVVLIAGTISASEQRSFPICTDDTKTYAIVYFNGSSVFMEEATYQSGTITIDTTKQRIVTTDDLIYDMLTFDEVIVSRKEKTEEVESNISNIANKVRLFFEAIKSKIVDGLNKNEGSATEDECRSTTGG